MSYRDPRDDRTSRYEPGYNPETRAYSRQPAPQQPYGEYGDRYTEPYGAAQYGNQQYGNQPYEDQHRDRGAQRPPRPRRGPDINPGLFVGGVVMTGVVTGLAAWLVAWLIRAVVQRVNDAGKFGVWNPVANDEYWFAIVGFLCALAAGALWYVLQLVTPSPDQFYRWIVALLLAAAVVIPLVLSAQFSVGLGTAVMHLVIGLPLLTLIPAMGQKSRNR